MFAIIMILNRQKLTTCRTQKIFILRLKVYDFKYKIYPVFYYIFD